MKNKLKISTDSVFYLKEEENTYTRQVKISHGEATRITVESLIKRYKACNDSDSANKIKDVLVGWYLTEEEFKDMVK